MILHDPHISVSMACLATPMLALVLLEAFPFHVDTLYIRVLVSPDLYLKTATKHNFWQTFHFNNS